MGNSESMLPKCISCKEPVKLENTEEILSRIDMEVPAYCSRDCQLNSMKDHWSLLMKFTERSLFNKLLIHLAGIVYKQKTAARKHTHTCIYKKGVCILCVEVAKHCKILAKEGCKVHQYQLGYCYEIGSGVPQSDIEAAKWYAKAAAGGHKESLAQLEHLFHQLEENSRSETSVDPYIVLCLEDPS
jgi:hypothetical protein